MKKTILTILTVAISIISIAQNNFYVSPNGNNTNDGSLANPWKTISFAAQNSNVLAGDTVNIMAGTYTEQINFTISGEADAYITFKNYQNDEVIISGSTLPAYEYMIKIEEQHHIRLKGLKIQDYQQLDAIGLIIISSSYITIEDNEFSNIDYSSSAIGQTPTEDQNSQPIIVFGRKPNDIDASQGIEFFRNKIHDCETGWSEALSINGHVDGFEIAYNEVYDNTNIAIVAIGFEGECSNPDNDQARNGHIHHNLVHDNPSSYAACAGVYVDGAAQITIENNTLYNNDYGVEVGCENNGQISGANANNILVQNNLIYNNTQAGIALGGFDYPTTGFVDYTVIRNNTLYNNDTGNNYQGEFLITYTTNSVVENNIIYTNNSEKVLLISENENPTLSFNYNLFYIPSGENDIVIEWNGTEYNTFVDYMNGTSHDANSVFAQPLFVDNSVSNPNLHLQQTSPAINIGNPATAPLGFDIDEEERINDGRVDCGADEYYASTGVNVVSNENSLFVYPNPTNNFITVKNNNSIIGNIQIIDITGKVVKFSHSENLIEKINISDLQKGIYLIKNGDRVTKFIKE